MPRTKRTNATNPEVAQRDIQRVIAYIRISKDRETQTSIETQEYEVRELAKYKKWEVVKVLADPGRSAYKKGVLRPEYNEAIAMIERGQADAIVVFKLDRFSRSAEEFWNAWQAIKKAGGHFVSVSENFDTTSTLGQAMLFLVATFAEMESEMKRDRAIPMHAKQQRDGAVAGGPRPYGYDRTNSKDNDGKGAKLTINQKEADLLKFAAMWIIEGKSMRGFINTFQPESSQAQKTMTHRGLRRCLLSPTVAGLREHRGTFVKGNWDAILPRETWEQVREILEAEDRKRPGFRPDIAYLLTGGILTCSKCGKNLGCRNWTHKTTKEVTKRYQCRDCGPSIDMDIADGLVTEFLFTAVPQSKWEAWQTQGMGWDADTIKDIESRMSFVDKMFSDRKIDQNRWLDMMSDLEAQKESALNEEPMDIPQVPNLQEAWPTMDLDDRRRVIRQAFESIQLMPLSFSKDHRQRIQAFPR